MSRADDLVARDLAAVWHPFTQHSMWPDDEPLVIDRGEGVWLFDADGRRFLDGVSSLWVTVHGHGEPAINAAIAAQLERLDHSTFLGLTHEPGVRTAEELLRVAPPDLTKVFFAGDGSSAAEAAIKMAYQAAAQRGEDRPLYVHFAEGYHGDTLG
ncbi:MAG TPA: aminotransferase class III-fold pyridoxal phosphate-dependent enzyme, partial [Jatrophihabitantaceae bacterium]|nr:aminotransferase class III-fold pyridoxal phosphate-dependent enzyme [Jatrophihabitantaceae bacterium]